MNVELFIYYEVSGMSIHVVTQIKSNMTLLTVDRLQPGTTRLQLLQPFFSPLDFVWGYPGEQVPER